MVQCVDKIFNEVVFSHYAMTNMAPKRTIHAEFGTGPIVAAPDACTAVFMAAKREMRYLVIDLIDGIPCCGNSLTVGLTYLKPSLTKVILVLPSRLAETQKTLLPPLESTLTSSTFKS